MVKIKEERCIMCGKHIPEGMMICKNCEDCEPNFNTATITVSLNKFKDIANFVNLASKCRDDVVVKSGNYSVNAKSIMGLLSLDLSKPVKVEFYGDIPYEVRDGMKKFIISQTQRGGSQFES